MAESGGKVKKLFLQQFVSGGGGGVKKGIYLNALHLRMGPRITLKKFVRSGFSSLASTCRLCDSICDKNTATMYTLRSVFLTISRELNEKSSKFRPL